MNDWSDLPLFPLNTVLFPGMVLPLHIFEERYKQMIGRCMEENCPFGVVLIRQGEEVGGGAIPHHVGTTAVIAGASQTKDGRYNLVTIGSERFRLRTMRHDLPYLVGSAEPWPLAGAAAEPAQHRAKSILALFKQYVDLLVQAQGHRMEIEQVPEEPRALALLVAIALQVPLLQKQYLLCRPSVADLLRAEQVMLRRERLLLEHISDTQREQWEGGYSGYLAKN
jgi:Lon protease-like protein